MATPLPFKNLDYIFLPDILQALKEKAGEIKAYAVRGGSLQPFTLTLGELTDDERQIIEDGCLINYNRNVRKRS